MIMTVSDTVRPDEHAALFLCLGVFLELSPCRVRVCDLLFCTNLEEEVNVPLSLFGKNADNADAPNGERREATQAISTGERRAKARLRCLCSFSNKARDKARDFLKLFLSPSKATQK